MPAADTIAWGASIVPAVIDRATSVYGWTHHVTQPGQGQLVILHKPNPNGGVKLMKLNIWCTTGCVGSYLKHPRQGNTQLFRRPEVSTWAELEEILANPRVHTTRGYQRRNANCDSPRSVVPEPRATVVPKAAAPASGPATTRGTVRFFDFRKRFFGFITAEDGRDIFCHRNHVKRGHRLFPGSTVEFIVTPSTRGAPQAKKVKVV